MTRGGGGRRKGRGKRASAATVDYYLAAFSLARLSTKLEKRYAFGYRSKNERQRLLLARTVYLPEIGRETMSEIARCHLVTVLSPIIHGESLRVRESWIELLGPARSCRSRQPPISSRYYATLAERRAIGRQQSVMPRQPRRGTSSAKRSRGRDWQRRMDAQGERNRQRGREG